ncbi:MAG: 3'(2'),5'-bisphosphate nucleotidase CysQ [Rhizobiaceae bacterium]|nr:3'(2'),5'-bisphosphate nucleotidase CysQ [Rhizobiaceae bacterium]
MRELFERLALAAGRRIMEVFHGHATVEHKADASPVTEADRDSERIILAGLRAAFPQMPCVAEEESAGGIVPTSLGDAFFLVDPLDGTKEFVNRRTDFTVNIALVRRGVPEVGVVFAPCSRRFFSAEPHLAEQLTVDEDFTITARRRIHVREAVAPMAVVASRSHLNAETEAFIHRLKAAEIVSVGSSLKFCLLAAGEADLYPRFGPTMEWDTAAGDAVLRAAGGLTLAPGGRPLGYGKRGRSGVADFLNPSFVAIGRVEAVPAF